MTERQFSYLVETGILESCHPATYRIAGSTNSWEQQAIAAVLSLPNAVLSKHSAARLWGLTSIPSVRIHVTSAGSAPYERIDVDLSRSKQLAGFTTTHRRIAVTTVPRTIVDLSGCVSYDRLGTVIDQASMLKLAKPAEIQHCLDKMVTVGRSRISWVREQLALRSDVDANLDTFLEKNALEWIRKHGFADPVAQHWVRTCETPYRLDLAYLDAKIDIEPDGPHHLLPSIAAYDRIRDADLSTRGWIVIRVPVGMPEQTFIARLENAFRSRALSA